MRFAVPVLSLLGFACSLLWIWFGGRLQPLPHGGDVASLAVVSVPYLLLVMFVLQALSLLVFVRANRRGSGVVDVLGSEPGKEQTNTEWVLDTLAGGVIVVNPQRQITYMNVSAEKLTLWSREKALGMAIEDVLILEDLQGNPILKRALETHSTYLKHPVQFGQVKLLPRVGDARYVELHTTCVLDDCKAMMFIFRDVTADRKVINRLYRQASRDALTDLMNRTSFEQYVEQVAHDTSSLLRTHVLASVDLDNFKTINDSCGHLAGDELLKQVAQIFRHAVRTSDKVARIGGDEFAVFLEGCGREKGRSIMEAVLTELRNFRFSWEGRVFSIGASIGLLEFM